MSLVCQKLISWVILKKGIESDSEKIHAVINLPEPENKDDVWRFMGMVNFLSKFLPNMQTLTQPLRELLKSDSMWIWGTSQRDAFEESKRSLVPLQFLHNIAQIKKSSSYGLGTVLMQEQDNGKWRPVVMYLKV